MSPENITYLLTKLREGDADVMTRLMPLVYRELRRLAAHYMKHERPDHTLQATALVHEVYLKLAGQQSAKAQNRVQFFAVASQVMRHVLVDYATLRRGDQATGPDIEALSSSTRDLNWHQGGQP